MQMRFAHMQMRFAHMQMRCYDQSGYIGCWGGGGGGGGGGSKRQKTYNTHTHYRSLWGVGGQCGGDT